MRAAAGAPSRVAAVTPSSGQTEGMFRFEVGTRFIHATHYIIPLQCG